MLQATSIPDPHLSFGERATIRALRINTVYHDLSPIPAKGHLEPRIDNLPRRRKASDKTVRKASDSMMVKNAVSTQTASDRKIVDGSSSATTAVMMMQKERYCLQELVPNLFVAFSNEDDDEDGDGPGLLGPLREGVCGEVFTHIVNISSDPRPGATPSVSKTIDANGAHRLHLIIPNSSNDYDDGQTALSPQQLLASRNFLSQAMPRAYHLQHVPGEYLPAVCILITSTGGAQDAMSVAACYLAYESGNDVHTVLECINAEEEDIKGVWRGVVSRDGIEFIESVARS